MTLVLNDVEDRFLAALRLYQQTEDRWILPAAVEGLAAAWAELGSPEPAVQLLRAPSELRRAVGPALPPGARLLYNRAGEGCRSAL